MENNSKTSPLSSLNELSAEEIDAVAGGKNVNWGQVGAGAAIGAGIGLGFGGVGAGVGGAIGGVVALVIDLM